MLRDGILTASWQAAALALLVWLVIVAIGRWIPARWRCALWSLVFIRLILPALPPSPLSLFNLTPTVAPTPAAPFVDGDEVVTFGVVQEAASAVPAANLEPPPRQQPINNRADRLTMLWLGVAALLILRMACAYA